MKLSLFGGPTRLIFIGSPRFAVPSLQTLVRQGHDLAQVVTQPARPAGRGKLLHQPPVAAVAEQLGLPVFQPQRIRAPESVLQLQQSGADVIVVAAYGQILPRSVLDIPALGCINVHPSLLPRHRGAAPIPASILAADAVTGVTIMLMDEGMDTGPILAMQRDELRDDDDQVTLTSRLSLIGAELLATTLADLAGGQVTPAPQTNDEATTSRLVVRDDALVDWTRPATEIWRQVRAYAEWPQATSTWRGRSLRIVACGFDSNESLEPGMVAAWGPLSRSPQSIAIGTGRGVLLPSVIGIEGKRAMPIDAFLRGQAHIVGARLGTDGHD